MSVASALPINGAGKDVSGCLHRRRHRIIINVLRLLSGYLLSRPRSQRASRALTQCRACRLPQPARRQASVVLPFAPLSLGGHCSHSEGERSIPLAHILLLSQVLAYLRPRPLPASAIVNVIILPSESVSPGPIVRSLSPSEPRRASPLKAGSTRDRVHLRFPFLCLLITRFFPARARRLPRCWCRAQGRRRRRRWQQSHFSNVPMMTLVRALRV